MYGIRQHRDYVHLEPKTICMSWRYRNFPGRDPAQICLIIPVFIRWVSAILLPLINAPTGVVSQTQGELTGYTRVALNNALFRRLAVGVHQLTPASRRRHAGRPASTPGAPACKHRANRKLEIKSEAGCRSVPVN